MKPFLLVAATAFLTPEPGVLQTIRRPLSAPLFGVEKGADALEPRLLDALDVAMKKMKILQAEDYFLDDTAPTSLKNLHKQMEKAVAVGPSSIPGAGLGLFSLQNIKAGTVVTLYPVDAVGFENDQGLYEFRTANEEDQRHFERIGQASKYHQCVLGSRPLAGVNVVADGGDMSIFIDANPNRPARNGWLGHYVNDGAIVTSNDEKGQLQYYAESRNKKNCVSVPFGPSPIMALVTTRKVKKGEELFTSYGCLFWMENLLRDDDEMAVDDVTEAVQLEARQSAVDLFRTMQSANLRYASQQSALCEVFDDIIKV